MPRRPWDRDYDKERISQQARRESVLAGIEANLNRYVKLPTEFSCKTCENFSNPCYIPRTSNYPNGNAADKCACCLAICCSLFQNSHLHSRRKLQTWLDRNSGSDGTRFASRRVATLPQAMLANTDPTNVDHDQAVTTSASIPATVKPVSGASATVAAQPPSSSLVVTSASCPSFAVSSTSDQSVTQVEGNSTASSSKRSRSGSDSGFDTFDITHAKAARLDTAIMPDTMPIEKASLETLQDTHFGDLILGLIKHHETVSKAWDDAKITIEEQKANLGKNEAVIQVLKDQKAELENDKGSFVMERDAAAVLAREETIVANERHTLQLEKAESLIKSLEDQKAEWERERVGLLKNLAAMLAREKSMDFENRYTQLEDKNKKTEALLEIAKNLLKDAESANEASELELLKNKDESKAEGEVRERLVLDLKNRYAELETKTKETEALLEYTQNLLKNAELAEESSEAELQREKDERKAEEEVRESKAVEDKVLNEKMEEKREGTYDMIRSLRTQLHDNAKEMVAMKDKTEKEDDAMRIRIKELESQKVGMEAEKRMMSINIRAMEVRLEEMENLRTRNISAVHNANAFKTERNEAQASLATAQGEKNRILKELEQSKAAFNAAGVTIQKLQNESSRLIQKESAIQVAVKPKLANLQANYQQLEADKKRLETEIGQAKQRISELEARLHVSYANVEDHSELEKDLVASSILAANYKEQRDEARVNLLKSDEAKTDLKRNWNVKSAEMLRLHAEIRKLKGEEPRISEGIRADSGSGSIGEVEGLIDMSMED